MNLTSFYAWLEATSWGTAIRENELLFPTIESIHVIAITLVFGTIALVDLRLLCLTCRDTRVSQLTRPLLTWTWSAFTVAAISGSLLFSSNAAAYGHNLYFRIKMLLMLVAGINMLLFHFFSSRTWQSWDHLPDTPTRARVAGAISLMLWIAVVACGRWIGFTMLS